MVFVAEAGKLVAMDVCVNGQWRRVDVPAFERLSDMLRLRLGLTGVKLGCSAGDCGSCTVLVDGRSCCSCLMSCAQARGREILTVEGLADDPAGRALQEAFGRSGAAQCGICSPGMLMAARDLLGRVAGPDEAQIKDALGGVLCRCTGYQPIVEAVLAAAAATCARSTHSAPVHLEELCGAGIGTGEAVGARAPRLDGANKLTGLELYGADAGPPDALWCRVIRSPHAHARFEIGDIAAFLTRWRERGGTHCLLAHDIPGAKNFGVYPHLKDQPVLASGRTLFRGEAVAMLLGTREALRALEDDPLPVEWFPCEALASPASALEAPPLHEAFPENILASGLVERGDVDAEFAGAAHVVEGTCVTHFVEHAYIELEAGYARRVPGRDGGDTDTIEIFATTQAPYMDRDEVARVLGLAPERVRIIPSACGGGFGGKLDVSIQPLLALGAWISGRPVRIDYSRPESMASTTKRHASRIRARAACDAEGRLTGFAMDADFDTGAYASWGPTVADRVPIHASGPYRVAHLRNRSRAIFTNAPPAGAFRGFGIPQAALAGEALMDALAARAGLDPLEFRLRNALRRGDLTPTGQRLDHSVGMVACLDSLAPRWREWRALCAEENAQARPEDPVRGAGIGAIWYGCGNTSMSNPSRMRVGIDGRGVITLYNGAVDMGQGPNTIMAQITADALGAPLSRIRVVMGDTARTFDAGKSSASRQTFVSGRAAQLAGEALRARILRLANAAGDRARIIFLPEGEGALRIEDGDHDTTIDLDRFAADEQGDVLTGEGQFDPPTTPLDRRGQGAPYATYGFGAQIALVRVDRELGTICVEKMVASHDVGRAINPLLVEGQIIGGIAQGLGMALMEEYVPGRTENLHDYLIPSVGDMPGIECILIEDPEPLGPYGAKGVGEHALVGTAPAILGGVEQACGVRLSVVPALPHRVRNMLRSVR